MLNFIFKKTNELNTEEVKQICSLFLEVYNKKKTKEKYEKQFGQTSINYSYHGLMLDEGKIVGSYTAVPFEYNCFNKKYIFALSVDTMISKKYRGVLSNLKKMAYLVYDALINDGIPFIYGFPNENFYLVKKKLLGWVDIGRLDYFVLPIKISLFRSSLRLLDVLSMSLAAFLTQMPNLTANYAEGDNYAIEKNNDQQFLRYRYDDDYKIVRTKNNAFFVYKIGLENGVQIAYLIDVFPLCGKMIKFAVNSILRNERGKIAMIGYLGKLRSRPINLFKVPQWLEPQAVKMSGKILIANDIDNRVFDLNNWNINLSNFDVR